MTRTYDTHCPVCHEAITVDLEPDPETTSGYYLIGACDNECLLNDTEQWCEWAETLEDASPEWWESQFERQQLARNVATGLQPALFAVPA